MGLNQICDDPIDPRELADLEQEFIQKSVAELTDDVTIDPAGDNLRDSRLQEIESIVGEPLAQEWANQAIAAARKCGYASGKPFDA